MFQKKNRENEGKEVILSKSFLGLKLSKGLHILLRGKDKFYFIHKAYFAWPT